jgi:serine/threonine-protein kinase
MEPTAAVNHHNLALALSREDRLDEAIAEGQIAVRLSPNTTIYHWGLGVFLDYSGRHVEGLQEFRRAVALDPKSSADQHLLWSSLLRLGRAEEARLAWEKILASGPPDHDAWYGYAELCLFLGREDEYLRAREALLARFEERTEPQIAERTSRACLLLPASEDEFPRIVTLAERAVAADRSKFRAAYPNFLFVQGLAEFRRGRLDRTISLMRGDASRLPGPAPRLVLAMALHRDGQVAEARKALAKAIPAHDWRLSRAVDQDGWIAHILLREAEAMMVPDLPAFLDGRYQPRDNDERLAMLGACQSENRAHASARLYADIFASAGELAEDLKAGHRYRAACAAALAGCGQGADAGGLTESERKRWRDQARRWLRADLAAWNKALHGDSAADRDRVKWNLTQWRRDPDLAGLRDPAELDKLPADEQKDCLRLWDESSVVRGRTGPAS